MRKRSISILLALLMVLSSAGMSVFALETEPQAAPGAEASVPDVPTGLKTYSACESVALEWKPVAGATSYNVYRSGKLMASVPTTSRAYDNKKKMAYVCEVKPDKNYKFQVSAVNANGESDLCEAKKDGAVKQMYIRFTMRTSRRLTSHDGKKKTMTIPAGKTFKAIGYGMGKYHFYYKGYLFYVNYMSVRNQTALYTTQFNYSKKEAEYFIGTSKQTSLTNKLIWVNLYTQHLYIFSGKKGKSGIGKWKVSSVKYNGRKYSNWEVASGTAYTPSPWGLELKYRGKPTYIYSRSRTGGAGAFWWNKYHSQTALHGRAGNGRYGKPASHGCIRNTDQRAKAIYYKIPLKTRCIVF